MIAADRFIGVARELGFVFYTGVPCSYLKPFINYAIDDPTLRYVGAANEGDAAAIASGVVLAGGRAVAMFQNSGLGNAVNPLTSLNQIARIPILLIVTLRGEPGGPKDEPQHELMGAITTQLLDLMRIPWAFFPEEDGKITDVLQQAAANMAANRRPYALVMRKGAVASWPLQSRPQSRPLARPALPELLAPVHSRAEILQAVRAAADPGDVLLATTGYTGRELYALGDRANQLYMVGSMGCASSLGLGLALQRPDRRVIVLDGDGALLMRLGALSTVGYERPSNLLHVLLDNQMHESTGGQSTVAHSVDFCAMAQAAGYPLVARLNTVSAIQDWLAAKREQLGFLHVPMLPGVATDLPRPDVAPAMVATRLQQFLGE
jgi:phosphonopyruvate decarboxylase